MDKDIQDLDKMLKEVHNSPRSDRREESHVTLDTSTQDALRDRLEEDRKNRAEEEVISLYDLFVLLCAKKYLVACMQHKMIAQIQNYSYLSQI